MQNAPILDPTGNYVQVSRDDWDATLNYAHHLATFKNFGVEFMETIPMLDEFFTNCKQDNSRVKNYGLYTDVLFTQGGQQARVEPR